MSNASRVCRFLVATALSCLVLGGGLVLSPAAHAQQPATGASAAGSQGDLMFHKIKANRVLFLGNSITLHGPAPAIGWQGNWGMAASAQDKDYVHLVLQAIAKTAGKQPQSKVANIADFERQYASYDLDAGLKEALAFKADVVIVAIGENVPALATEQAKAAFQAAMTKFLAKLKANGNPVLVVRSGFWQDPAKDTILKATCQQAGGIYVDQGSLGKNEANYARSERQFSHAGVAAHPGDRGMQAIADSLLQALRQSSR